MEGPSLKDMLEASDHVVVVKQGKVRPLYTEEQMATKLDKNFADGIKQGVQALIYEVERLEALQEKKDRALIEAKETIAHIVSKAPGYDWNSDPLSLTLMTGNTSSLIDEALK